MELLTGKILELSSRKSEDFVDDFIDVGTDLVTSEKNGHSHMRNMASKGYTQSGSRLTVALRPKLDHDTPVKKPSGSCC